MGMEVNRVRAIISRLQINDLPAQGNCQPQDVYVEWSRATAFVIPGDKCVDCLFNIRCNKSTVKNSGGGNVVSGMIDKDHA